MQVQRLIGRTIAHGKMEQVTAQIRQAVTWDTQQRKTVSVQPDVVPAKRARLKSLAG
jgi:hypothetical protein